MAPDIHPFVILIASIFTSNILLGNFLGMCSFIVISKDFKSSNGLGMAVTVVLVITAMINYGVLKILQHYELEFLQYIVFIMVIAAAVQILEMAIDRFSPSLYMALGIFLPLITVNCAVLGVALFMQIREYDFIQTLTFAFGSGLGWWMAIMALAGMQQKILKAPVPEGLKGAGITIITIGMMAMGFTGFSGMLPVQ